jgi:hypothetical protein
MPGVAVEMLSRVADTLVVRQIFGNVSVLHRRKVDDYL